MNDCGKFIEMLSAYYDGELSADDTGLVRGHLDTCESCAALLRLFGGVTGALGDTEPPPELRGRVMKTVLEKEPRRDAKTRLYVLKRVLPVAACLAVALLALSLVKLLSGSKSDNSSAPGGVSMESALLQAPRDAGGGYAYDEQADGESAEDMYGEADIVPFNGAMPSEAPAEPKLAPEDMGTGYSLAPPPAETPAPKEAADAPETAGEQGADTSGSTLRNLEDYYAVFKLPGGAPPLLDGYERVQISENNWRIYIPLDVALALIGDGYDYVLYNEAADEAVVILSSGE